MKYLLLCLLPSSLLLLTLGPVPSAASLATSHFSQLLEASGVYKEGDKPPSKQQQQQPQRLSKINPEFPQRIDLAAQTKPEDALEEEVEEKLPSTSIEKPRRTGYKTPFSSVTIPFPTPRLLGFPTIESFFTNFATSVDWSSSSSSSERKKREAYAEAEADADANDDAETEDEEQREKRKADASHLGHLLPPQPQQLPLFPPLDKPLHGHDHVAHHPTPEPSRGGHHVTISTPTHHISHGVLDHGSHHSVHKEHHQVHGHQEELHHAPVTVSHGLHHAPLTVSHGLPLAAHAVPHGGYSEPIHAVHHDGYSEPAHPAHHGGYPKPPHGGSLEDVFGISSKYAPAPTPTPHYDVVLHHPVMHALQHHLGPEYHAPAHPHPEVYHPPAHPHPEVYHPPAHPHPEAYHPPAHPHPEAYHPPAHPHPEAYHPPAHPHTEDYHPPVYSPMTHDPHHHPFSMEAIFGLPMPHYYAKKYPHMAHMLDHHDHHDHHAHHAPHETHHEVYVEPTKGSGYAKPAHGASLEDIFGIHTKYHTPKPAYHEPKSAYHEPKPVYHEPKPVYHEPEPAYHAPTPAYHEPEPAYHAPKPAYHEPEPAYHAPKPAYHEPEPAYHEPEPAYHAPKPAYHEPKPAYHEPEPAYHVPEPAYHEPEPAYHAPKPAYHAPKPAYHEPEPAYHEPEPAYHAPVVVNHKTGYAPPHNGGSLEEIFGLGHHHAASSEVYVTPRPDYHAPEYKSLPDPGYVLHYLPYENYQPVHAESVAHPHPVPHHPGAAHILVPGTHPLPPLPPPVPHPDVKSLFRGA